MRPNKPHAVNRINHITHFSVVASEANAAARSLIASLMPRETGHVQTTGFCGRFLLSLQVQRFSKFGSMRLFWRWLIDGYPTHGNSPR